MAALEHLIRDYTEPVKDPVWNNILFSPPLLRLAALPAFQKLNGIRQLGPAYLVYPGATHTRLCHSLGVFHLARRLLLNLLTHPGDPGAMPAAAREPEAARAFLCAALLHDLGHYPFAHSLKDLEVASHESLTGDRVLEGEVARVLRAEVGVAPELVAAIVDPHRAAGGEVPAFYRRLLSGVLDPDKLDYLTRDAYFCGVPHGVQDVDFALAELRAQPGGLAVTRKGLSAVESILFAKYLMYRSVYWHKTVRIATAMIKKAVLLALTEGVLEPRELYWLDDQEFFALAARKGFPPLSLAGRVARRQLFKQVASLPAGGPRAAATFEAPGEGRGGAVLSGRLEAEAAIAREASRLLGRPVPPHSIIIDVPEPISFEVDLPVLDSGSRRTFAEAEGAFDADTVRGFARSLRRVALIADPDPELVAVLERMGGVRLLGGSP